MKKIAVIYWSGTGNTEKMAAAVAEGAKNGDNEVKLLSVSEATKEDIIKSDFVALGCPSMGCEVLEETEMEPFVTEIEKDCLSGKPLALFGSFDWGDGQWLVDWQERMEASGAKMVDEGLKVQNTPNSDDLALCKDLGRKLINS